MGMTNFSNGIASQGVPIIPDIPLTTGSYFFVNSVVGSDNNPGTQPTRPLATVQKAINLCTAGKHDHVIVMPGHVETVTATSIAHNKADVKIIGLGIGSLRPTFTFNAAASTITVTAARGRWENCWFIANFADVASAFTLGATSTDFWVTDCLFTDTDATHNFDACLTTGSTANASDGLTMQRNVWYGLTDTNVLAFCSILGTLNRLVLTDNDINTASTANIGHFLTTSSLVVTNAYIARNTATIVGNAGGQSVGAFLTGSGVCYGIVEDNLCFALSTAKLFDTATATSQLGHFENYMSATADNSGILLPANA